MTVGTHIFQAFAHEAKRLVLRSFFYLMHPLYGLLIKNVTADPIHGVSRIAYDSPSLELLGYLRYEAGLGIVRVNLQHIVRPEGLRKQLSLLQNEDRSEIEIKIF
jgi:hypothetical protein